MCSAAVIEVSARESLVLSLLDSLHCVANTNGPPPQRRVRLRLCVDTPAKNYCCVSLLRSGWSPTNQSAVNMTWSSYKADGKQGDIWIVGRRRHEDMM